MPSPRLSLVLNHLYRSAARQATDDVPDQQLLERFVAGHQESAFAALVERHGPMVFAVCRRVLRETHDAEDAFQATFLVLARKAVTIRKRESLSSWLHGVALRVSRKACLEGMRRSRRERQRPVPATAAPSDGLTWGELRSALDEELGRLPVACRAPLVQCYLQGQTQEEAARQLGWSKSTFRRRLERGRRLLQSRLARRGLTLSAGLSPLLFSASASAGLPKNLLVATVKTGLLFQRGETLGTAGTVQPAALAETVLQGMVLAKSQLAAAVVLILALLGGAGLWAYQAMTPQTAEVPKAKVPPTPDLNKRQLAATPRASVDQFGDPLPPEVLARLGTTRFHHGAVAWAIGFAPDGQSLASAGYDGVIHIWETKSGKELLHIENRQFADLGLGAVLSLAFAPNGKTLATARINQPACLWDVATGKELRQFGGSQHRASWVMFAPDGKTLAYGGGQANPGFRLADVNTGKDLHRFESRQGPVTRVAFAPDGKTLVFADPEAIHVVDLVAGRRRQLLQPERQAVHFTALAFSPGGKTLAVASHPHKLIRFVEVATGKVQGTIRLTGKRQEVRPILFTPDGTTLISGHEDGSVRFWDTATGARQRKFHAHGGTVIALALSRDGRTLATSCNSHIDGDHTVRLWETAMGKPVVKHPGPQQGIARVVFAPDSKRVATTSWEGAIHVWEAATGKLLRQWQRFGALAFTPDGGTLVCGDWSDGKVRLLDLATGKVTRQWLAHPQGIRSLGLARDGKTLATAGNDGFLRLWDLGTGRPVQDFGGKQKSFVFQLALSPDGTRVATIHQDHAVRLWETATGKLVREHAELDCPGSLAFSPNGKLLASTFMGVGGRAPMIRVRDVATGKEIAQLRGEGDPLDAAAFSADGRTLIWGGQHRKDLYLWEIATGQLRRQFSGHQGHLTCVAFSPNGRMMASGGSDALVLIWDVTGQGRRQQPAPVPVSRAQLDRLWADLAARDAALAYQAMCTLRAVPARAVALFKQHVKPMPHADAKRMAQALRHLDSTRFQVRQQATKELEQLGEAAEPALREVLAGKPSVEIVQRVERLLRRLAGTALLRRCRTLEVLENIGDPPARRLLTTLAQGAPKTRLTKEAQAALERLGR